MAPIDTDEARALLAQAETFYRADTAACRRACAQILFSADAEAFDPEVRVQAALLHAYTDIDIGALETGLQLLLSQEQALRDSRCPSSVIARLQFAIAQNALYLGSQDDFKTYYAMALENADEELAAFLREWQQPSDEWLDEAHWRDTLAALRIEEAEVEQTIERFPSSTSQDVAVRNRIDLLMRKRFSLMQRSALLEIMYGEDDEALEGCFTIAALTETWLGQRQFDEVVRVSTPLALLLGRPSLDLLNVLEPLFMEVAKTSQKHSSAEGLGQAQFILSILNFNAGLLENARELALDAVALGIHCVAQQRSLISRQEAAELLHWRRELALRICVRQGDALAVAELIETDRPQSLPTSIPGVLSPRFSHSMLAGTEVTFGATSQISVQGRSILSGRGGPFALMGRCIELEDVIASMGCGSWWWASYNALDRILWVVRRPQGGYVCGETELSDADTDDLAGHASQIALAGTSPVPTWRPTESELSRLRRLGAILVPEILRSYLVRVDTPVSVVVSSNFMGTIALPILIIDGEHLHLIERCDLRLQPPAALVSLVASRAPARSSGHVPILISCMDPQGNLDYAFSGLLKGETTLTSNDRVFAGAKVATREGVVQALRCVCSGTRGIFYYSGHVQKESAESGRHFPSLQLADGVLSAADWFGLTREQAIPAPSYVVIGACSSSGSSGVGAGEWLGLAASALHAGAVHVIATAWPIYDSEFTRWFDEDVVLGLRLGRDAARVLADSQRRALYAWRSRPTTASPIPFTPLPEVFAAYQCVSGQMDSY